MVADEPITKSQPRANQTFSWPRFWVPRDSVIDLSDSGFLRDPMEIFVRSDGPVQLASLQHFRSLVLLGEPGIGKSTTLKEESDRVAALNSSDVSFYADLRNYSSETLLYQRIFESRKIVEWKSGTSHLFPHLDSLDEALLQ